MDREGAKNVSSACCSCYSVFGARRNKGRKDRNVRTCTPKIKLSSLWTNTVLLSGLTFTSQFSISPHQPIHLHIQDKTLLTSRDPQIDDNEWYLGYVEALVDLVNRLEDFREVDGSVVQGDELAVGGRPAMGGEGGRDEAFYCHFQGFEGRGTVFGRVLVYNVCEREGRGRTY